MEYEKWINPIIAFVGLIVAIIALVPSFLSLGRNEPKVYFASSLTEIQLPDGMDASNVLETLSKNNIPHGRFQVQIINNGEGPVSELKLRIEMYAVKGRYETKPTSLDNPAWIVIQPATVSNDTNGVTVSQIFKDVAVGKSLNANIWFEHVLQSLPLHISEADVQVYYDGKEGIYVDDINKAPKVMWISHFQIPAIVVGASFALMLCIAILVKLKNDPSFRKTIYDLFLGDTVGVSIATTSNFLFKIFAFFTEDIKRSRETKKDEIEGEHVNVETREASVMDWCNRLEKPLEPKEFVNAINYLNSCDIFKRRKFKVELSIRMKDKTIVSGFYAGALGQSAAKGYRYFLESDIGISQGEIFLTDIESILDFKLIKNF